MNVIADPELFFAFKEYLVAYTGLAKDALHIHIGLLVFVLVRLIWRGKSGWVLAWIVALAAALAGEYLDIKAGNGETVMQPDPSHWHDIWNTMLWPTVLLVVGRWLEPRRCDPDVMQDRGLSELPDQSLE